MTTKIFISYRRQDSAATAGRLSDHIRKTFGRSSVFMDVSDMPLGKQFVKSLDQKLAECDTFLAVIGTNWLSMTDQTGNRRIDEADDPVRTEIVMALSRKMLIIPVLVDGAVLPKAAELPEALRALVLYQAVEIRNSYFERDADALTKQLEGTLLRFWRWRVPIAALVGGTALVGLTLFGYGQLTPIELLQAPSGVAMIDPAGTPAGQEKRFDFRSLPGADFAADLEGTYSVKRNAVEGILTKGTFRTTDRFRSLSPTLTALAFRACYLHVLNGRDQMDTSPSAAKAANSTPLNISPKAGRVMSFLHSSFNSNCLPMLGPTELGFALRSSMIAATSPYNKSALGADRAYDAEG